MKDNDRGVTYIFTRCMGHSKITEEFRFSSFENFMRFKFEQEQLILELEKEEEKRKQRVIAALQQKQKH